MPRRFEIVEKKKNHDVVYLPLRGTKTSAGYDFYTPVDLEIPPQSTVFFWTDVKASMEDDEALLLDIRSSLGIKSDLMLANTIPIVDSDYYNNKKNEGNIGICLRNLKPKIEYWGDIECTVLTQNKSLLLQGFEDHRFEEIHIPRIVDVTDQNTVFISAGERVVQGLFIKYLPSENCNTEVERSGGIGSSGKE